MFVFLLCFYKLRIKYRIVCIDDINDINVVKKRKKEKKKLCRTGI